MSKIKNGELDQYGTEHFERQQLGTVGTERLMVSMWAYTAVPEFSNSG